MNKPESVTVDGESYVTDALINFNLGSASPPGLYVLVEDEPDKSSALPAENEVGSTWIGENDAGLFWGWKDGPVQPPADTSAYTKTIPVEHAEYGVEDRVSQLSHVVANKQNELEPDSALQVEYAASRHSPRRIPTRVETARTIINRYVEGPLGSDYVSRSWYKINEVSQDWASATWPDEDDYREHDATEEIVLVKDNIRTWVCKRAQDVEADDEQYGGN